MQTIDVEIPLFYPATTMPSGLQTPTFHLHTADEPLDQLIDETVMSHQPLVIKGTYHNAILLSETDWLAIQDTLYLLSIPGRRESIQMGLEIPVADCSKELEW